MAKEIAIGKRAKISKAQQNMIIAVFGASVFLGAAIALVLFFIKQISFNTKVIMEEEKTIVEYSNVIKSVGICKSPKGSIYTDKELADCNPDSIDVSEIPDTLRSNILEKLAANRALNSVPTTRIIDENNRDVCINPETGRKYTYKELNKQYEKAADSNDEEELITASQLIKTCSALRVIPEALPDVENQESLLASLQNLFQMSNWTPEGLAPSSVAAAPFGNNLKTISISLSVDASRGTTMSVLNNVERSIREFDIETATIEWGGDDVLKLNASANAYYTGRSSLIETSKTITEGSN